MPFAHRQRQPLQHRPACPSCCSNSTIRQPNSAKCPAWLSTQLTQLPVLAFQRSTRSSRGLASSVLSPFCPLASQSPPSSSTPPASRNSTNPCRTRREPQQFIMVRQFTPRSRVSSTFHPPIPPSLPSVQHGATCILPQPALDKKYSLLPSGRGRFLPITALNRTESATCSEIDFPYSPFTSRKPQSGSLP